MKVGIKYVRKANMWVFYIARNIHGQPDTHEWFATQELAQKRYDEVMKPEEHDKN